MANKSFWSGAIAVVTIAIAGASAVPSLLLGPAPAPPLSEISPIAAKAVEPMPAEPVHEALAEPKPVELAREPASEPRVAASPPPVVEPAIVPAPQSPPAPQVAPAEPASAEPVPPAPVRESGISFPPVQPVGIGTRTENEVPLAATRPSAVVSKQEAPAPEKRARGTPLRQNAASSQRNGERKRAARPAPFPIREFLAWRR